MHGSRVSLVVWIPLGLAGCPGPPPPAGPSGGSSSGGYAFEDAESEGDASDDAESDDVADDAGPGRDGFVLAPDVQVSFECDVFAQDCPTGSKCMPYADDGGNVWNATTCTAVDGSPGEVGDACAVQGAGTSGVDDCVLGAMCWDTDPRTGLGTCIAMCEGSLAQPQCDDPKTACTVGNDGSLALCLPTCAPLLQDCAAGQACYPVPGGSFACAPDSSGAAGQAGDPCGAVNACDPGLMCAAASTLARCSSGGCCTELCQVDDPDADGQCAAAGAGQSCEPVYAEGQVGPGYASVGLCVLPQ